LKVHPFVNEGLGNSSYLIELDDQEAILVDPDRTVDRYLAAIEARGLRLAGVFETHLHADFVSGSRELASRTGAPVFAAEAASVEFTVRGLLPGRTVPVGGHGVTAIDSPGHTPEHLSYLLRGPRDEPALFSGGSLIVGGAARTDLISREATEELTRAQFRTLRQAFASLADETLLYPTHGGGSFCSTGAGIERVSTLGRERQDNPLLGIDDEEEFLGWFPKTFPATPAYFARMRTINQRGPRLRKDITLPIALSPADFAERSHRGLVVDARSKEDYARGHIPGSLSITYRDSFPVWLGWLAPAETQLSFVTNGVPVEPLVDDSLLVGYERFGGWLEGGIAAWEQSGRGLRRVEIVDATTAKQRLLAGALALDVRELDEHALGHLPDAVHVPLGELAGRAGELPRDRPVVVYCAVGDRASSGASLLEAAGFKDISVLGGGIGAWRAERYPVAT
jgi:hydroxyacylglutathione hydrolase